MLILPPFRYFLLLSMRFFFFYSMFCTIRFSELCCRHIIVFVDNIAIHRPISTYVDVFLNSIFINNSF